MAKNNSVLDINDILDGYCDDIESLVKTEVEKIAKEGVKELKSTSPINKRRRKKKGSYAKGWKIKKENKRGEVHFIIHNATNYQLTHLLENGHLNRDGSKTKAIVHIAPVAEKITNEFVKRVENGIKKGNSYGT